MSLFQQSVQDKYIKNLDAAAVQQAWQVFTSYFHNPAIQQNIRDSKEEEFQEGFLRELFVNVLGYTLKPHANFNLTTEYRNIKDTKKADGAILINNEPVGVIELKGTNTTDLTKVETQAFGYKNNHPKVTYIVIANFEKLNFYIDTTLDPLTFNLFTLGFDDFKLLYLCLAYTHIAANLPKKIKDESVTQEDKITKQLYADYAAFKTALFDNIRTNNPQFDALVLYKSTQKLLDRLLFIFFAEDRNLLPPNSIRSIITQWEELKDRDAYAPLYERLKKYFGYMNVGHKGKLHDIFAYNGGLFLPDDVLDTITIDDDVLHSYAIKLSDYNYQTEVDVNILGHIFENSLNELDEVKATLEGREVDKSKTKRKKDGVFYTPKYITKYIVDNTVGRLCTEKKAELQLVEEDYTADKKRNATTKKALDAKLESYRTWLLQITIVDPACGSGAFLNQALDFLITEHRYIDELRAKLFGYGMVLTDVENSILENNLFGVDINEESVDIAKLSLWLRTAQPRRKLNNLNNNIKCGNSLIDDPAVAGDKAFNWQTEFADVFARGGFDVVIGNPPYGAKIDREHISYLSKHYNNEVSGEVDTYIVFYFKSLELIKSNALLGFITPDTWLTINRASGLRKIVLNRTELIDIHDWYKPFADAKDTRCHSVILRLKNTLDLKCKVTVVNSDQSVLKEYTLLKSDILDVNNWNIYSSPTERNIFVKMATNSEFLENLYNLKYGLRTGDNDKFLTLDFSLSKEKIKIARGSNILRYYFNWTPEYLISKESLPSAYFEDNVLNSPKIIIQYVRTNSTDVKSRWLEPTLINEPNFVPLNSTSFVYLKNSEFTLKYLLTLISSNLLNYYYKSYYTDVNVKPIYLSKLPIPKISLSAQQPFIEKSDEMLRLNKELQEATGKFTRNLMREFSLATLPGKLQNWHTLTYAEFLKELSKLKVSLTLAQKAEWEDYFTKEQSAAQALTNQIQATDKAIDQMVYTLYNLTPNEIKIVEGA